MTDTLIVVIIASVVGACTATLTGAFQHYFHYLQSLIWVAFARALNMHSVEFHQTKVNSFGGTVLDLMEQDSHCRSFTYKTSSWADGNQHHFIFLPTPTWKAYWLQVFMLGHWIYVPSDPKKSLSMLVSKDAAEVFMLAANYLDRNEDIPDVVLQALRRAFHCDMPTKSLSYHVGVVWQWLQRSFGRFLVMCFPSELSAAPLQPLSSLQALLMDREDFDVVVHEEVDFISDRSNEYTLFLYQNKYLDKIVKPLSLLDDRPLSFTKDAPIMYVVDASDNKYSMLNIANQFRKNVPDAILGLYYYDPHTSAHFSQLHEVRASNKELNLILYLPMLDLLEESLPLQLGGFEAISRKRRCTMLIDWINFLNEISNSCFTFIALVLPEIPDVSATVLRQRSQFLRYANVVLYNRVKFVNSL